MPSFPENYPDAYKVGKIEFFYLPFFTDKRALIPRLETEDLVREAIKLTKIDNFDTIVDIGTGSGIIAVSLAKNCPNITQVIAIDLHEEALELAKKNAEFHKVNIEFLQGNLLSSIGDKLVSKRVLFVTNLPYIRSGSDEMSEDTIYEPASALFWGDATGFELYEKLFDELAEMSNSSRFLSAEVLCEAWHDQSEIALLTSQKKNIAFRAFSDLFGVLRFFQLSFYEKH